MLTLFDKKLLNFKKYLCFCCLEQTKNNFEALINVARSQQVKEQSGDPGLVSNLQLPFIRSA